MSKTTSKSPLPHRNTYVVAMNKRCKATRFAHKATKRSKDAKKSWRRDWD